MGSDQSQKAAAAKDESPGVWDSWNKTLSWIGSNPVTALSVAGLVVYALLRLSATLFYSKLGFTPDEVGLGYATMLGQAFWGLVDIVLVYALVTILLAPTLAFLWHLPVRLWSLARRRKGVHEELRSRERELLRRSTQEFGRQGLANVAVLFVIVGVISTGANDAPEAFDGKPTTPTWRSGFAWQAEAAKLHPIVASLPFSDGQCVLYLGQASGELALFDPATHTSYRVPAGSVVVETGGSLPDVEHVPEDC